MIREHDDEIDELRTKVKELECRLSVKYDDKFTDKAIVTEVRHRTGVQSFHSMEELTKILNNDLARYKQFDTFNNEITNVINGVIRKHQKILEP